MLPDPVDRREGCPVIVAAGLGGGLNRVGCSVRGPQPDRRPCVEWVHTYGGGALELMARSAESLAWT